MPARIVERVNRMLIAANAKLAGELAGLERANRDLKSLEIDRARLIAALDAAHDQLTADLAATSRLFEVGALFLREDNLATVFDAIVGVAVAIAGADFATLMALDRETGELGSVAQRGLTDRWLELPQLTLRGRGANDAALARRERVIVEDVEGDPILDEVTRARHLEAGIRAIQATPLLARTGEPLGVLTTHYRAPGRPRERTLRLLDLVARQAADILECARSESALRDSEGRFRALVEASSEVLYRMSPDWSEIRELRSSGFLVENDANRAWLQRYIHPDDQDHVKAVIDAAIRGGTMFELEHRVLRPDGTIGWTLSRAVPVTDARGKIVEWFGAAADVTARKRAELALADANRQLVEADERKNEFIAMLSHEVRNPLAPIQSSLDILERVDFEGDQARRAWTVIKRQIEYLTRMIEDLLDITRISRGKVSLEREPLDLNELAQRTAADYGAAFAAADVALDVRPAAVPVYVNGDRTRLAQVIGNLLQNAVKFTPRGGKAMLSILEDAPRRRAIIEMADTGRGIAPEALPAMFAPFAQADPSDRKLGGLGLGLAVVKGLVQLHGGSVRVASDGPGLGTTLTIELPLTTAPVVAVRAGSAGAQTSRRVLVIEDNIDAAEGLSAVLELVGHDVKVAHAGPDGIDEARSFHPDVVVCDIGLPDMDGYEVARVMRATPELADIALVALTGYARPDDVTKARAAGFDAHLAKPVSLADLERVVATLAHTH
jgi:PAS domain S-box-containing protein